MDFYFFRATKLLAYMQIEHFCRFPHVKPSERFKEWSVSVGFLSDFKRRSAKRKYFKCLTLEELEKGYVRTCEPPLK